MWQPTGKFGAAPEKQVCDTARCLSRFGKVAILLPAVLLMTGCWVVSLDWYFDPKDAIAEPALVGSWVIERPKDEDMIGAVLSFELNPDTKKYRVTDTNRSGRSTVFEGYLTTIKNHMLLQLALEKPEDIFEGCPEGTGVPLIYLLPARTLYEVRIRGRELLLLRFNDDWLHELEHDWPPKRFGDWPSWHDHKEFGDNEIVLTGSANEIRRLLERDIDRVVRTGLDQKRKLSMFDEEATVLVRQTVKAPEKERAAPQQER